MNTSLQAQEGLYTDTAGKTLPDGWERHETVYGIAYYIDRVTEVTSWESPVLTSGLRQTTNVNANGDQEDLTPLLGRKQQYTVGNLGGVRGMEVLTGTGEEGSGSGSGKEKEKGSFMERVKGKKNRKVESAERARVEKKENMVYLDGVGWFPRQKSNHLVSHT